MIPVLPLFLGLLPILWCQTPDSFAKQAVVSVSRPASEVGAAILRDGGNAVDAAIATAFALAVTHPQAGNIAGGGFMVAVPPAGRAQVVDFRETAPARARERMFQPGESTRTAKTAGVPGSVAGLELAHKSWGKLPWSKLVDPAVRLAREGFIVELSLARSLNSVLPETTRSHPEFSRVFSRADQQPWQAGDRMVLPELAVCLQAIRDHGRDGFYKGFVAGLLVAEMEKSGGLISRQDLMDYRAVLRDPIRIPFRDHEILAVPPPSSGGVCLALLCGMLETRAPRQGDRFDAANIHFLAECMRRTFRERARWIGDPAFATVPKSLLSQAFARELAAGIRPDRATPSESLAGDITLAGEGGSTTHLSVIDADGFAVSLTTTLEDTYGSRVVTRGGGFILNNEMGDFNWIPGRTTRDGRIGTPPNLIAPGKRMLSSQCPVVVLKEGKVIAVCGSPGGRTIPNTVMQVLWNLLEWQMEPRLAVDSPRIHHQWFPDQIRLEAMPNRQPLADGLKARGHTVILSAQGDAHTLWVDRRTGRIIAAPDRRIEGAAAGN